MKSSSVDQRRGCPAGHRGHLDTKQVLVWWCPGCPAAFITDWSRFGQWTGCTTRPGTCCPFWSPRCPTVSSRSWNVYTAPVSTVSRQLSTNHCGGSFLESTAFHLHAAPPE